jgi:hypothetical protein
MYSVIYVTVSVFTCCKKFLTILMRIIEYSIIIPALLVCSCFCGESLHSQRMSGEKIQFLSIIHQTYVRKLKTAFAQCRPLFGYNLITVGEPEPHCCHLTEYQRPRGGSDGHSTVCVRGKPISRDTFSLTVMYKFGTW